VDREGYGYQDGSDAARRNDVVKRTSLNKANCPVARSLDAIGDWWSLLIVRDAIDGMRRFNDFQKGLGVSKGILATRLRSLVALGVLETAPAADGSAYREYLLTKKGRDLFPVVVALRQWGEHHCFAPGEPHSVLIDNYTGQRVGTLELRSSTGRVLTALETSVERVTKPTSPRRSRARRRRDQQ
jgi:DNA-binding HxlR family transcriptional regulator